jgi:hypothetical protein
MTSSPAAHIVNPIFNLPTTTAIVKRNNMNALCQRQPLAEIAVLKFPHITSADKKDHDTQSSSPLVKVEILVQAEIDKQIHLVSVLTEPCLSYSGNKQK